METFNAHKLVSDYIRNNKVNKASLGRALKLSSNGIMGQTQTNAMKVDFLAELSAVLKHNFFADLAQEFPKDFDKNVIDEKETIIKSLELEIMILKREKETLTNIIKGN